jgi:RimJ/RimL family protein N-acetyltransferase
MQFFPRPLTREESDRLAEQIRSLIEQRGWGLWAVEIPGVAPFIGSVGLHVPPAALPFSPCVEIGWRLAAAYWGQGYATEAARGALRVGFERLELQEIVSFTSELNQRSRAVMERLGMQHRGETFDNPNVPIGNPLRPHVLYRLSRAQWSTERADNSTPPMG